jgi:hypothetical protein
MLPVVILPGDAKVHTVKLQRSGYLLLKDGEFQGGEIGRKSDTFDSLIAAARFENQRDTRWYRLMQCRHIESA